MFVKIKKILDRSLELLVTISMVVLVLDVTWGVFSRYILGAQSTWTEELATFLMIWVGMLGASVALNRGAHLGIDYFVGKLTAHRRLCTEIFVFFCVAAFSLLVMFIGGIKLVTRIFQYPQHSPAMGLNMAYVYLAMPISGFFLTLYSSEFLIERIVALIRHRKIETPHDFESTAGID